jgi:hypothetical protein
MYRIWYWAMVDREYDGRFIASIPDLGDLAAYGKNEKDAVALTSRSSPPSTSGRLWRGGSRLPAHGTLLRCRAPFDPRKLTEP